MLYIVQVRYSTDYIYMYVGLGYQFGGSHGSVLIHYMHCIVFTGCGCDNHCDYTVGEHFDLPVSLCVSWELGFWLTLFANIFIVVYL